MLSLDCTLEIHPLIPLKRGLLMVKPLLAAECCDRHYGEEDLHTQFTRNQKDCANCEKCGAPLLLLLRLNWWAYPEIKTSYFPKDSVLEALRNKLFQPEELDMLICPSPLLAAVRFHCGSLREAYQQIGVEYPYPEIADWKHSVYPFLGTVPDGLLAELINVKPAAIRRLRQSKGISGVRGYNKWKKIDILKIASRIQQRLLRAARADQSGAANNTITLAALSFCPADLVRVDRLCLWLSFFVESKQ